MKVSRVFYILFSFPRIWSVLLIHGAGVETSEFLKAGRNWNPTYITYTISFLPLSFPPPRLLPSYLCVRNPTRDLVHSWQVFFHLSVSSGFLFLLFRHLEYSFCCYFFMSVMNFNPLPIQGASYSSSLACITLGMDLACHFFCMSEPS